MCVCGDILNPILSLEKQIEIPWINCQTWKLSLLSNNLVFLSLSQGTVCSQIDILSLNWTVTKCWKSFSPFDTFMLYYVMYPKLPRTIFANSREWTWTCYIQQWVLWVRGLPFKAQVTHHTQNTACLNGSVAVLLYGLLQKLLPILEHISPCMIVKYCCKTMSHERSLFTLRDTLWD